MKEVMFKKEPLPQYVYQILSLLFLAVSCYVLLFLQEAELLHLCCFKQLLHVTPALNRNKVTSKQMTPWALAF